MRPSLISGTTVGLATGAWMFTEYVLGLHDDPGGAGRWTGFLALAFPVLGARWLVAKAGLTTWTQALREGLVFGATGGGFGGAAIYLYFTSVNPGFSVGGRAVDAGAQAFTGFAGALVLGCILTMIMYAWKGRKGGENG